MVMGEHEKRLHELSLIALADSNPGSLGRPGQAGQQQRGQDGDDGDYHQQLDERKRRAWPRFHFPSAFNSLAVLPPCLRRRLLDHFDPVEVSFERHLRLSWVDELNLFAGSLDCF